MLSWMTSFVFFLLHIYFLKRLHEILKHMQRKESETVQAESDFDSESSAKQREKLTKELKLLKHTVEEMELRIEAQKKTLTTRDESIRKLMHLLQTKGM